MPRSLLYYYAFPLPAGGKAVPAGVPSRRACTRKHLGQNVSPQQSQSSEQQPQICAAHTAQRVSAGREQFSTTQIILAVSSSMIHVHVPDTTGLKSRTRSMSARALQTIRRIIGTSQSASWMRLGHISSDVNHENKSEIFQHILDGFTQIEFRLPPPVFPRTPIIDALRP